MSFRLRHFALRASHQFPMYRPIPVHSLRPPRVSYRAFGHSRLCRDDKYVPSPIPAQRRPPVPIMMAPTHEAIPPKAPRNSTVRRLFRFVPWKSIIVIGVGIYFFSITEKTVKESIQAIVGQFTVPDDTWIYLNLNDLHITDSPHSERALQLVPFVSSSGKRRMTVLEMITAISAATADTKVKGLVLSFNESIIEHRAVLTGEMIESHLGMGALNELRSALLQFRRHKKQQRESSLVEVQPSRIFNVQPGVEGTTSPKDFQGVKNGDLTQYSDIPNHVIVAISDNYSSGFDYSLAFIAQQKFIQPTGSVHLTGMSMQQLFFGKVLEKYGIDFKVEARREYKSALASFVGSAWNKPTRENLEDLLWSLQSQTLCDLQIIYKCMDPVYSEPDFGSGSIFSTINKAQRSIRGAQKELREGLKPVMDLLQLGPFTAEQAIQLNIVTRIGYHHELLHSLADAGIKLWSLRKYYDSGIVQSFFARLDDSSSVILQLLRKKEKEEVHKSQEGRGRLKFSLNLPDLNLKEGSVLIEIMIPRTIGLIYLDSAIEGKGRFGGEAMAAHILKAAKDPKFDSIVLRINSPGGDAVASDTIWRAIMAAKAVKPVIASFGDVAASGGYYAAAAADVIFSNPDTITGSIGVISGWPVIKRLLEKVDVTSDSIEPTPNAAWRHMELGLPESEMEKLRKHTDEMYESFKKVVSIGRKMPMEDVEDIAQGQVFTGCQAMELGLVDALGGLSEAIEWASLPQALRENPNDLSSYLQYLDEDGRRMYEEVSEAGVSWQKAVRDTIIASTDISDPDPEEIRKLVQRRSVQIKRNVNTIIIPHINPAGEALSAALATAFQTDDERSPVPVDLPVIGPGESSFSTYFSGRVIIGALVGIALSNNIPLWQFPAFCFWYAAQASGKIGTEGMVGGFLNSWFGKLLKEQGVFQATERPAHVFAGRKTAWDVRMEMPPFQIFF